MKTTVCVICMILAGPLFVAAARHADGDNGPRAARTSHQTTQWFIEPSFKYDALCLINTLSGDPYYLEYYRKAYAEFEPKLTPTARKAIAGVKRIVKDEGGGIISARLCLLFSATNDESLDDMLATLKKPDALRERFAKTPYWGEDGWRQFESFREDLGAIFDWYKQIGFEQYWREKVRPAAAVRAEKMRELVRKYNIVPLIESHLGKPLESDKITVHMLTFSQPHGIKITGTRFLTDVAWPFEIVVRNAVHEMMHPPYRQEGDAELNAVIEALGKDAFLKNKVEHHNPSFGYNTLGGFVEEDCVQALEQLINEKLRIEEEAQSRWKDSDGGMHVLAVALYQLMKDEGYPSKDASIRDFLVRMSAEGRFKPGSIEEHHRTMYGG